MRLLDIHVIRQIPHRDRRKAILFEITHHLLKAGYFEPNAWVFVIRDAVKGDNRDAAIFRLVCNIHKGIWAAHVAFIMKCKRWRIKRMINGRAVGAFVSATRKRVAFGAKSAK